MTCLGRVSFKSYLPSKKIFLFRNTGWHFFRAQQWLLCSQVFLKQNLCPFQKLRLWFILITFLKFRKFQPRHFFKISSYKKGVSFFTVMKTTPLQLTVTNSMIWGTLPLKDPGIGIGTVSPSWLAAWLSLRWACRTRWLEKAQWIVPS